MANDNLRSGPLGATAQASKLKHQIVQLVPQVVSDLTANTVVGAVAADTVDGSKDRQVTKATANSYAFCLPAYEKDLMGGEWTVENVFTVVHTAYANGGSDAASSIDIGIYALNTSTGVLTEVDSDAIVDGFTVPKGSVQGLFSEAPTNGVGGKAESYQTAAGNTVSLKLGRGVAQFTASDASVAGQDQVLVLTNTTSTGNGKYSVFVSLKPVGGPAFSN